MESKAKHQKHFVSKSGLFFKRNDGCTVVVSTVASQQERSWGLSVWSLHVLPVYAGVLSGYSGFLPPSKNMHVRLIGVSKLSVGVSGDGCLSCLCLCNPVMDWRLIWIKRVEKMD